MITTLRDLALLMARNPLSVDEVMRAVGEIKEDYGQNVLLHPRDPRFSEANVIRSLDDHTYKPADQPSHLILQLAEPLPLAELERVFGSYATVEADEKVPEQAIFYLDLPDQPCSITLIAAVDDEQAHKLTLMREPA